MAERRTARLPVTPAATAQALAYQAALGPLLDQIERLLAQLERKLRPRLDSRADGGGLAAVRRLLAAFAGDVDGAVQALLERLEKMLRARAVQVDRVELAALQRQVQAAIRVTPRLPRDALATVMAKVEGKTKARTATRDTWVRANIDLIKGLGDRTVERVGQLVRDAASSGTRVETLARQIQEQAGVNRRRADLLARDQTTKLASQFQEAQLRTLGAKSYVWRHSGIRPGARPEHRARDGQVFRWDRPPAGGHPGAEPNCRCTAEPLAEELLGTVRQPPAGRPIASNP